MENELRQLKDDQSSCARQGAGYFVNDDAVIPPEPSETFAPAQDVIIPAQRSGSFFEAYTASLRAQRQEETIDFGLGVPRPSGLEDLQRIARRAVGQFSDVLFNYDFPEGQPTLRKQVAQLLVQSGLEVSPEQLIITCGSMQGLSLGTIAGRDSHSSNLPGSNL